MQPRDPNSDGSPDQALAVGCETMEAFMRPVPFLKDYA